VSQPYIGEIRIFAGNFAPNGWAFCNGAFMPIEDYDTLFNLIGTTYGGDGVETFALPNLSSRIPVGVGPDRVLGQAAGQEAVTLNSLQLPVHSHRPQASTREGTAQDPGNRVWAASGAKPYTSEGADVPMSTSALSSAGGNEPHENMPPYLAVNYIISLFGIYPSPS
jgi:microcystin-dependent protein